jgi:hypothetical protein
VRSRSSSARAKLTGRFGGLFGPGGPGHYLLGELLVQLGELGRILGPELGRGLPRVGRVGDCRGVRDDCLERAGQPVERLLSLNHRA